MTTAVQTDAQTDRQARFSFVLEPPAAGMHLVARFPPPRDDLRVSAAAARGGLDLPPLARYYAGPHGDACLLIHSAGTRAHAVR